MVKALNDQLNAELYSSYLYFAMAAYCRDKGLNGCARWMEAQALEELSHAVKFYHFIAERGGRVSLGAIEAPPNSWASPLAMFEDVAKHESKVTGLIHHLVDLAIAEKDHATNNFLQWFVSEQVEEEASVGEIVQQMKLMGEAGGGLFMLDKELGQRVFVLPPGTTLVAPAAK